MRSSLLETALIVALMAALAPGHLAAQGTRADAVRLQLETELREDRQPSSATFARGDSIGGRAGRDATLSGGAEIRRDGLVIRADRLTYYEADNEVVAIGNVRIVRDGQVFTGPQLQLKLDAGTGRFESPAFLLPMAGGQGRAASIEFLGPDSLRFSDATYSTCRPEDPDWYLQAETLTIDQADGGGVGNSARLVFLGVPILAAPAFAFPIGSERRSGLLPPSVSLNSRTGTEFRQPYYWDIAPNRDLTVTPTVMARRGVQLGGEFRYLEPTWSGQTFAEYLPNDRVVGEDRWLLDSNQLFTDLGGWSAGWRVRAVSDDNYFVDFSRSIVSSAERSLPREFLATRSFGDWNLVARALQYQNILDARDSPPFDRLPQLLLTSQQRDVRGFDFGMLADASWFTRKLAGTAEGARLVVNPSISRPMGGPGWFVTPKLSVHASAYRLDANPFGGTDIDRMLPTASIDSGLVFERPFEFGGRSLRQTLEPRLLYVYTPYQAQDDIPVFDSAVTTLSYATLFSDRLYSGQDRIANANQLTPGVVSRLIDPETGIETLRLGIAQRYYFEPQRVTLPGVPIRNDSRSDLLLGASAELGGGHGVDAGMQLSMQNSEVPQFDLAWRWWPSQARLINLAARYREFDFAQLDASWRWPVARRWTALGRLNYSVLREQLDPATGQVRDVSPQLLEAIAGFEYSADCWILRLVAQSFVTAESQRTSAFFVQLELGGLARIGLNPLDILVRNISGYRVPDQRPASASRFLRYE